jgi:hypothetical protein
MLPAAVDQGGEQLDVLRVRVDERRPYRTHRQTTQGGPGLGQADRVTGDPIAEPDKREIELGQ